MKADFILIILPIIISPSFAHQMILLVASRLFSQGENHLDPELWQNSGATRVSVRRTRKRNKLRTARTPNELKLYLERQLGRAIQILKDWHSYDCTSGLRSSSLRMSLRAPKQRSVNTTNRSVLALSQQISCRTTSTTLSVRIRRKWSTT